MVRRKSQRISLFFTTIYLAVGLIVTAWFLMLGKEQLPVTQKSNEKYYWQDSKYKGIRTRVAKQSGSTYQSFVEYPVTKSPEVNQRIADTIDEFDRTFHAEIEGRLPAGKEPFMQNTSYQVIRMTDDFLSIEVVTSRNTEDALVHSGTAYWTFNLETGSEVTLADLFGDEQSDGQARLFIYLKRELARQAKLKGIPLDADKVANLVTQEHMKSFLAPDADTLRFDFGQGVVSSESDDPLTVTLSISNLQLFLQSETARRLFTIMPIGDAPEWKAPEVNRGSVDCARVKCIALTFDDGPGVFTNKLLDTLQQYKAHASFFLIGKNAISYKDVVKRMQNDGHTIGNHSWDHKSLPLLTPAAIDAELSQTNTEITKITGILPSYMRPPGGALAPNVYAALQRQNMTAVMWSVDTRDWADRNSDIVYNRVVSGAKPGAIIILHDIHNTSVDAVPRILKALQRQGYAFVSIDELFGPNAAPGKAVSHAS